MNWNYKWWNVVLLYYKFYSPWPSIVTSLYQWKKSRTGLKSTTIGFNPLIDNDYIVVFFKKTKIIFPLKNIHGHLNFNCMFCARDLLTFHRCRFCCYLSYVDYVNFPSCESSLSNHLYAAAPLTGLRLSVEQFSIKFKEKPIIQSFTVKTILQESIKNTIVNSNKRSMCHIAHIRNIS